ncbi:MAG: hypothetical protein H7841_18125, partial [Magnetospirillum sp. WYHS-4]
IVAWAFTFRDRLDPAAVEAWIAGYGTLGMALFVLAFAAGTVLFLPGALFGPILGTLYNLAGATLGATVAFLAARYLAGDWVAGRAGSRLGRLVAGVEAEGWRFVAFTRLVPQIRGHANQGARFHERTGRSLGSAAFVAGPGGADGTLSRPRKAGAGWS